MIGRINEKLKMIKYSEKNGGERGIRTPETLLFTHFPGVRLRPLGHLSKSQAKF
jgi:hypothetical protein